MKAAATVSCRRCLAVLAGLALLVGLVGCEYSAVFPAGHVRVTSNGVNVFVDSGTAGRDFVEVDLPFVHVEVRD